MAMNMEEYKKRIESAHTFTGVPSYWQELQQAVAERDNYKLEIERLRRAIETFINVYYNCYTTREIESLAIEELKQAVRGE